MGAVLLCYTLFCQFQREKPDYLNILVTIPSDFLYTKTHTSSQVEFVRASWQWPYGQAEVFIGLMANLTPSVGI